jgi:hypothetical protein
MRREFYWLFLLLLGLPNLAVATREKCGDPPPPQFKEESDKSIKGDLEGKANFLSSWLGKAGLGAKIDLTRKEIFAKYPDANTANMDRYLGYLFCMIIFDPKNKQDDPDKLKALMEFYQQQQQKPPPPPRSSPTLGPGGPSAPGRVSQITSIHRLLLKNDIKAQLTEFGILVALPWIYERRADGNMYLQPTSQRSAERLAGILTQEAAGRHITIIPHYPGQLQFHNKRSYIVRDMVETFINVLGEHGISRNNIAIAQEQVDYFGDLMSLIILIGSD